MKTRDLAVVLLCSLFSVPEADAAGVNLRWNNCVSEGGVPNVNFACNTNVSSHALTSSFVLPADLNSATAVQVSFNLSMASASVPPWWELVNAGSCRRFSLSANVSLNVNDLICQDWEQGGNAQGGFLNYTIGAFGPATVRIVTAFVVVPPAAENLQAGPEYFAENLVLLNQQTVGIGSCSGCSTPVCIAIESIKIDVAGVTVLVLTQPADGVASNFATWQGGAGAAPLPGGACPAVVPTRNSTWGSVKSLYR
jgi:hypothetical protein